MLNRVSKTGNGPREFGILAELDGVLAGYSRLNKMRNWHLSGLWSSAGPAKKGVY